MAERRLGSVRTTLASVATAVLIAAATATAAGDVTVASHIVQNVSFVLSASDNSQGSYCITMRKQGRLDASACGAIFSGPAHGVSYLAHEGRPSPNYIAGPVTATATHVVVSFTSGRHLTIATTSPPTGLARTIRFYVHFMPCTAAQPRRIVGTNAAGHVVASLELHPSAAAAPSC